jgi:hypothetical protein
VEFVTNAHIFDSENIQEDFKLQKQNNQDAADIIPSENDNSI